MPNSGLRRLVRLFHSWFWICSGLRLRNYGKPRITKSRKHSRKRLCFSPNGCLHNLRVYNHFSTCTSGLYNLSQRMTYLLVNLWHPQFISPDFLIVYRNPVSGSSSLHSGTTLRMFLWMVLKPLLMWFSAWLWKKVWCGSCILFLTNKRFWDFIDYYRQVFARIKVRYQPVPTTCGYFSKVGNKLAFPSKFFSKCYATMANAMKQHIGFAFHVRLSQYLCYQPMPLTNLSSVNKSKNKSQWQNLPREINTRTGQRLLLW